MNKRDETGRFVSADKQEDSYGYYSNLLKKPFATLDELKGAEAEYRKAHEAELKKSEERKAASKEVEEKINAMSQANAEAAVARRKAWKTYVAECQKAKEAYDKAVDEANAKVAEAHAEYERVLADFCKKHGPYHQTITFVNGPSADYEVKSVNKDFSPWSELTEVMNKFWF